MQWGPTSADTKGPAFTQPTLRRPLLLPDCAFPPNSSSIHSSRLCLLLLSHRHDASILIGPQWPETANSAIDELPDFAKRGAIGSSNADFNGAKDFGQHDAITVII